MNDLPSIERRFTTTEQGARTNIDSHLLLFILFLCATALMF